MGMVSQPLVVLPRPPRHRRRSNVSAQVGDDVFVGRLPAQMTKMACQIGIQRRKLRVNKIQFRNRPYNPSRRHSLLHAADRPSSLVSWQIGANS
jgi:hypothetical protein